MSEIPVEIVFRKGQPVSAFFRLRAGETGRGARQIALRPRATAHIDAAGHAMGLELALPLTMTLAEVNDLLRELGVALMTDADLAPLRST